jgi:DNA-binding MarR family transcriptional regulator
VKATASRPEPAPLTALVAPTDVGLWLRLLESHNRVLAELRRDLEGVCTLARFDLLATLDKEDGITLATLSRRLLVTAGNVTGLVARAERDGLVLRRADKADRRLSRVHLTAKGRLLVAELVPLHGEHLSRLLGGLDGKERRDLHRLLGKLRDSLRAKELR